MMLLPACGKHDPSEASGGEADHAVAGEPAEPGEVVAYDKDGNPIVLSGGDSERQDRPSASTQEFPEPKYVYLPRDKKASENQVFLGYVPKEEKNNATPDPNRVPEAGDLVAKYQDVSKQNNTIAIPSVYGKAGETATASLMVCGKVNLCALDLRIQYDTEKLRYLEQETDDDLVINCDPAQGVLYINLVRIVNITENETLCDLAFDVLTGEPSDSPLRVSVLEVVALDEAGEIEFCPFTVVDGTLHLNSALE